MVVLQGEDILYKYDIVNRMHSGGQGRIVRLKRKSDSHVCVGKFYNSPDFSDWDSFDRAKDGASKEVAFLYRAREAGRTDVPRIIEHGVCGALEEPVLVMEEVPGRTLEKLLSDNANFGWDNILNLAKGVGGALGYAHSIGSLPFVHRDVKPANVMITPNNEVVVLDWSTAKVGSGDTQVNTMFNSLYYSAPEVMFGRSVSPASDVFGLAKVLEHCVLGQRFVDREGSVDRADFSHVNVPGYAVDALLKATDEKPEERYQSIDNFLGALSGNEDRRLIVQPVATIQQAGRIGGGSQVLSQLSVGSEGGCIREITADAIILINVPIYGPDGRLVRTYKEVHLDREVQKKEDGSPLFKTPMQWVAHFEGQGKVLPSLNVTLPCLSILDDYRSDARVKAVLDQYKQVPGANYGWHAQNTVFPWRSGTVDVIHFPLNGDVPENYRHRRAINSAQSQMAYRGFNTSDFGDVLISEAMQIEQYDEYLRGASGLPNLQRLIKIGEDLGKPAKVWVPNNPARADYTAACWLGCSGDNFILYAGDNLDSYNAARGVRLVSVEGAAQESNGERTFLPHTISSHPRISGGETPASRRSIFVSSGYVLMDRAGTYARGVGELRQACIDEGNSVHPTYWKQDGSVIFRPLTLAENVAARITEYNSYNGNERLRLFNSWLDSCCGAAYKKGSTKLKLNTNCGELIEVNPGFRGAFLPVEYDSLCSSDGWVELDSSQGDFKDRAWLVCLNENADLYQAYKQVVRAEKPDAQMNFWTRSNTGQDELRAVCVYNLGLGGSADCYDFLNYGARFVRAAPR